MRKYSKSVVVSVPDGSSRRFIRERAELYMPKDVARLITDEEFKHSTIALGPLIKKPKKGRTRS